MNESINSGSNVKSSTSNSSSTTNFNNSTSSSSSLNKGSNTSSSSNNIVNAITSTASGIAKVATAIVNSVTQNAATQPTSTGSKTTVTTSDSVKKTATKVTDTVTDAVTTISKSLSFIAKSTADKNIQTPASTASTIKQVTSLISQTFMSTLLGKGTAGTILGGAGNILKGSLVGAGKNSEDVSSNFRYIKVVNTPVYFSQNSSNMSQANILNTFLLSSTFNSSKTLLSISPAIAAVKSSAISNPVVTAYFPKNDDTGNLQECEVYTEGEIAYFRDSDGKIYKNNFSDSCMVDKKDYIYIPSAIGGTRQDTSSKQSNIEEKQPKKAIDKEKQGTTKLTLTLEEKNAGVRIAKIPVDTNGDGEKDEYKCYREGETCYYYDGKNIYKTVGDISTWKKVSEDNLNYVPSIVGGSRMDSIKVTDSQTAMKVSLKQEQYIEAHAEEVINNNLMELKVQRREEGKPLRKEEEDVYRSLLLAFEKEGIELTPYRVDIFFKSIEIPLNKGDKTIDVKENIQIKISDLEKIGIPKERTGELQLSIARSLNNVRVIGWKDYETVYEKLPLEQAEFITNNANINKWVTTSEQKIELMKRLESKKDLDQQDFIELGLGEWDSYIIETINLQYKIFKDGMNLEEAEYSYRQQQINDLYVAVAHAGQTLINSTMNKKTTSSTTLNKVKEGVELDELEFDKSKLKENNKEVDENGQQINRYSNTVNGTTTQEVGNASQIIKTNGMEEQLDFLVDTIPGLSREQAEVILDGSYKRGSTVVFGGSRVRGNSTEFSDLDIGFGSLTSSQAGKVIKAAEKVEGGLTIESTKIIPGNYTENIPVIESPEEFFQRNGSRNYPDSKGSMDIVPSGSITVYPSGEIVVIPPNGEIIILSNN